MQFFEDLQQQFSLLANAENAVAQKAYMKNKFEFFGLTTKERDAITKEHIKRAGILSPEQLEATVKYLYKQPQRDFHYTAIDLIAFHKKQWTENTIELIEYCIIKNSWWDSVDDICSVILTHYFTIFPQLIPITSHWNNSNNMWLQRCSIIFQNKFKHKTNRELLAKHIIHCSASKEFFIQKAIGWALRDYAAIDPEWVKNFVADNTLAALSQKEALRKL